MLENQFIQFRESIDLFEHEIAIPTYQGEDVIFLVEGDVSSAKATSAKADADISNIVLPVKVTKKDGFTEIKFTPARYDYYRIKVVVGGKTMLSNLFSTNTEEYQLSVLRYSCKEEAFGLPFDGNTYIQQTIPIQLYSPQYKQEDKIYTKRNGEQVVLFASITKEYEGETDYIPMEWHEKILLALSCDEVYINGERVTKSGNYEIDHDNCTYTDCGIKLMRATFKVTTNVTQRNSNY